MDRFDKVVLRPGVVFFLLLVLLNVLFPPPGNGQIPPGDPWRTLQTEHLRVTYPAHLEDLARRAGERGERAWSSLSEVFVEGPSGLVDLLITDHADVSNGYARVFPSNRIVVYAPPPVDGFSLTHMDEWMELVVTHELAHIFHEDYTARLGGTLRTLFGRVPLEWPFFPGAATPGWVLEGIATYYESELTQAGRVRGSFHEMVLRTAVLEDRFEGLDQTSGDSPTWPGGQRYYVYGSLFMDHLMDRYGGKAMGRFVEAVAGQWIPYRLNAAAEDAFGVSFSEAWEEWRALLEERYSALRDTLSRKNPLTRGEHLTHAGYYAWSPRPSPDGDRIAFARVDGRTDPQIRFLHGPDGEGRKAARTNNLSQFSWTPSGEIVFSQTRHTDSYRIRGDLFLLDSKGRSRALTRGERLDHPDVHPDGDRVVAVQEGLGSNRLVLAGLGPATHGRPEQGPLASPGGAGRGELRETRKETLAAGAVEPLTDYQDDQLWAYPRWSPDGRWIAAARWRTGAYYDVVILTPDGTVVWEVTDDRAVDLSPTWSPDGRWLLWSSDRSGIPNLYGVELDPASGRPGEMRQITNLMGGGAYPSVDPDSRWIYFSSYHSDGWRIERIPFEPETWFRPLPVHPRFEPVQEVALHRDRFAARVQASEAPYDPLPTLAPTYWAPTYRTGDESAGVEVLKPGFGIFTSGEDLVGRHAYSISGTYSSGFGSLNGRVAYTYSGLENPIFTVAGVQSHDAAARPLAGITSEGDTVPVFLVERERVARLSTSFLRRRSRHQTSLTLSGAHVWEDRFLLEENLEESGRFGLARPDLRSAEGRASLSFGTARRFPFSISPEDGVGALVRGRARRDLTVADSLRGVDGWDRSFREVTGFVSLYKALEGPGFGNHVLGVRASGGIADGSGADLFHFELGGASGADVPVEFLDMGLGLFFPLRGYPTAARTGRYAWSATFEYRFPIWLMNWGPGLFPLHLDRLGGTIFFDAGNAWGPNQDGQGRRNPRGETLTSWGGELILRTLPLWFQPVDLRAGLAMPLRGDGGPEIYLRLGLSF